MLIDFDDEITREDKDILESTDPDAWWTPAAVAWSTRWTPTAPAC
jgi:hypothetical protein